MEYATQLLSEAELDPRLPASQLEKHDIEKLALPQFTANVTGTGNELFIESGNSDCVAVNILIQGSRNRIVIGRKARLLKSRIIVQGDDGLILIGDKSFFDVSRIQIAGNNCAIRFGARFKANAGCYFLAKEDNSKILIGEDGLFSTNITVRTSDNHGIFDLETLERRNPPKDVTIEPRVWIGEDASVLKGAIIGHDVVIGTKSLVIGQIPPFSAAAGIPARVVRTGIFWYKHFTLLNGYDPRDPDPWP